MHLNRQQLIDSAEAAAKWAAASRASGKSDSADKLDLLAEIARQAAERFATRTTLVREDEKESASVRLSMFASCVRVEPRNSVPDAEVLPCPWSKELGICPGCVWKDYRWRFSGRVYECFTAWACGHQWPDPVSRHASLFS